MFKIVKAPDEKLRVKTKEIKKIPPLNNTFKEMEKLTLTFKDPEGVGLASTQVGLDGRFFIAKDGNKEDKFIIVINPKVISFSNKTKKYFEGCLSTPNIWGDVKRYTQMKVSYLDQDGKTVTAALKGVMAWIFQHEIDHLDGILFQDRVLEQKGKFYRFTGKDKTGMDLFEEIVI